MVIEEQERSFRGQLSGKLERARRVNGRASGSKAKAASAPAAPRDARQRVVVKVSYVKMHNAAGMAKAGAHLKYLERDGVSKEGGEGELFNARGPVNSKEFWERSAHDPHQFRVIISPEMGHKMDLERFAKHFVRDMERQVGSKLDWCGVAHYNTDHPHVHIIVRGTAMDGLDVRFGKNYIAQGMREHARDLATIELGERSREQQYEQQRREIQQTAYTGLDRVLERGADEARRVNVNDGLLDRDAELRRNALERLRVLEQRQLAKHITRGVWELAPQMRTQLQEHQRAQDIQKRLWEAKCNPLTTLEEALDTGKMVQGKLLARGLADEVRGSEYLVVEQLDGMARYVELRREQEAQRARVGEMVQVRCDEQKRMQVVALGALEEQKRRMALTWLDTNREDYSGGKAPSELGRQTHRAGEQRRAQLEQWGVVKQGEPMPEQGLLKYRLAELEYKQWFAQEQQRRAQEQAKQLVPLRAGERVEGKVREEPVRLHCGAFMVIEGRGRDTLVPATKQLWELRGQQVEGRLEQKDGSERAQLVVRVTKNNEVER